MHVTTVYMKDDAINLFKHEAQLPCHTHDAELQTMMMIATPVLTVTMTMTVVQMSTGHSLGGALATLAAYEISQHLQEKGRQEVQVVCYSFGAPRTGNHAFAQDYSQAVPDSWSIINDQVSLVCLFEWLIGLRSYLLGYL